VKIDLNLFIVFNTIYSEGNITKAAKVLCLSQPAVSHSLAKLRAHFDDPLFIRHGNTMRPTSFAKNVIVDVREALHQLQLTLVQAKQFDPQTSKKQCAISMHGAIEISYMPRLLARVQKEAPNINLTSTRVKRSELEHKLASGDVDMAIDILLPVNEDIYHTQIEHDQLVVVANKNHNMVKNELTLEQYLSCEHVLVSSRTAGPSIEDFQLGKLGLQRKVGLRCQHLLSASRIVANNNMLLTLPRNAAKIFSDMLGLTIYPLPVELPGIDVHLYWHVNVDKDAANKWLRNSILMSAPGQY